MAGAEAPAREIMQLLFALVSAPAPPTFMKNTGIDTCPTRVVVRQNHY
jgi:hypothetical protein